MKKVIKVAALGASCIALATTAFAADLNMNIYGASAQGKFWNEYASQFLEAPVSAGGMGCTVGGSVKGYVPSNSKLGITVGFNCAGNGGDDIYIRYTENKSVEGPRAVMNLDPQENDTCITGNPTNDNLRKQADWNGSAIVEACKEVHVGASDVASESFTQESHGYENGMYNTTQFDEVLAGQVIPGVAEIGTARQPIIVPFSFFANTSLAVDHINRQQALLLMSGNVNNWNQFGPGYENKKVVLCMRHAGSGTHATLDKAILRGDTKLPTQQVINVPPFVPAAGIMFHTSSSDLMKCVHENGKYSTATAGAIGYADSDKPVETVAADGTETFASKYNMTKRLRYNGGGEGMTAANMTAFGYSALKNEIMNGSYEFWSSQWMYIDQTQEVPATNTLFTKMMDYASTAPLSCPGVGCYWLTANDLNVTKADDTSVPRF